MAFHQRRVREWWSTVLGQRAQHYDRYTAGLGETIVSRREYISRTRQYVAQKTRHWHRRRARRQLIFRAILALLAGYGVLTVGSHAGEVEFVEVVLACIVGLAVLGTVSAGRRLFRLDKATVPLVAPSPPSLPGRHSLARKPMRELALAETQLDQLLCELRRLVGSAAIGVDNVARASADDSSKALRSGAERLIKVEKARDSAPPSVREELDAHTRLLSCKLDAGVDGYWQLVASASRAVANAGVTGSSGIVEVQRMLDDAVDHLEGLAHALRELDGGPKPQDVL